MMNQYPGWKYALILLALTVGLFFALPNLYGEDPAVQISPGRGAEMNEAVQTQVEERLTRLELTPISASRDEEQLLLRFPDVETQLKAQDAVRDLLGRRYVVALNLAPATPEWLLRAGALPMYRGLDLRGGVHFLMEVDMDGAIRQAESRYAGDLRLLMREEQLRYRSITRREGGGLLLRFKDAPTRQQAYRVIRAQNPGLVVEEVEIGDETVLKATLSEQEVRDIQSFALQQNVTTLRNRVNELGVAEPIIQQQGANRIVVQLPGVQNTTRAKEILGGTATLEFRMVDDQNSVQAALAGSVPPTSKLFRDRSERPILLKRNIMLTGEYIIDAASTIDGQTGSPAVSITLDGKGARIFSKRTRDKIGRPMAVVFIENKSETRVVDKKVIKETWKVEEVINVATIRDQLGKRFQITGLDDTQEARNLALLLRAGALAAPITIVEERTVGPTLGQENIEQGFRAMVIGFVAVLLFMAIYYRTFGLIANLALAANVVLVVALLSILQATLTLPGIAGIVLTVGMAVDANVLIFERIREEIRNGSTPQASIHAGYAKALSTIADANITTLIAALILFGFGTGPIQGFAVTLSIGIITSMFTAIMGTRAVVNLIYGGKRVERLSI